MIFEQLVREGGRDYSQVIELPVMDAVNLGLTVFEQSAAGVFFEHTERKNGGHSITVKDRTRKIIFSLKTIL